MCIKKSFWAILLILFSSIIGSDVYAVSVEVSDYAELKSAITDNAEADITLSADIAVPDITGSSTNNPITIPAGKTITIELNGHIISGKSTNAGTSGLISNNGTLIIKDNTDTAKNGTGTGKITFLAEQPDTRPSPGYASNFMNNSGTFILESGLIENTTGGAVAAANTIDNVSNGSRDSIITVNGGKIYSASSCGVRIFTTKDTYNNDITVNGGVLEGYYGIQLQNSSPTLKPKSAITINDGEIKGTSIGVYIYDESQQQNDVNVEINGGKVIGTSTASNAIYLYGSYEDFVINDGDFKAGGNVVFVYDSFSAPQPEVTNKGLVINGGNFETTNSSTDTIYFFIKYAKAEINGGSFSGGKNALYYYGSFGDAPANTTTNISVNGGNFNASSAAVYIYNDFSNFEINGGTFTATYPIYYYGYYNAGKTANNINGGNFNGTNVLYIAYMSDTSASYNSNIAFNGGNFAGDTYAYGYNGSWYFIDSGDETRFINGGYFADKDSSYWPIYIKDGFDTVGPIRTAPEGYPYTLGHTIILSANYDGGMNAEIYTLADETMAELYDFSRDGFNFLEWNTAADGSGEVITASSIIKKDTTLYAQWIIGVPDTGKKQKLPINYAMIGSNIGIIAGLSTTIITFGLYIISSYRRK